MDNTVIIVGAGPAGLMAALAASDAGAQVTILERNDRIGRKLLATGNGRCNFTNINMSVDNYHGENNKFTYSAFSQLDLYQTMDFFEKIGISPRIEDGGKVFPNSLQSSSFLDIFTYELKKRRIRLELNTFVKEIYKMDKFKLKTLDGSIYSAHKLILAPGGMALPTSGSDGTGYRLAEGLGHQRTDIFPGIVQLRLKDQYLKEKSGVRIYGWAQLFIDDVMVRQDEDDILFTDYGISGPSILQLSRTAIAGLREKKKVEINVKIINDKTPEQMYNYLLERFKNLSDRSLHDALIGYVNKKLISSLAREAGLDQDKKVAGLKNEEIRGLAQLLTGWKFRVCGHQDWEFAQVTAGGIRTSEIDNRTMESKIIEGLYFAGEIVDIDGDCGGYNLQWAWSSGLVAGLKAAQSSMEA